MNMQVSSKALSYPLTGSVTTRPTPEVSKIELGNLRTAQQVEQAEIKGIDISIGEEQLIKNIDHAIKVVNGISTVCQMSVHKETNMVQVKIVNSETGEIIREVPPEKTLDFVAKMMELAGIIVDKRV